MLIGGIIATAAVGLLTLYPRAVPEGADLVAEAELAAEETQEKGATPASPAVPTRKASRGHPPDVPLPALPIVPNLVPRPPEVITAGYAFAAHNPDILEFVPCFCGCETAGHTANADCFVESRNSDGTVRSWDTHGMACLVCVDVARDAMQLHASGGSVREIRAAIDADDGSRTTRQTPTPAPPLGN